MKDPISKIYDLETPRIVPDAVVVERGHALLTEEARCAAVCGRRVCRTAGSCQTPPDVPGRRCDSRVWTDTLDALSRKMLSFFREVRALEPRPNYTQEFQREIAEARKKFETILDREIAHRREEEKNRRARR
ncbi:hypothetical protein [Oricola cellulosilytica]|uniref:Uncharacterized protein n=1 Tax=Oricola cellulosilytica TaxID=1429082 RepID=A0A4R0PFX1_9HYPH|nr:hypothetical protein [Oricola cellulosilytica]TCD15315.1 hypothetical protein E0D97_07205 [Oricola cellulosilytica]